jgi:hypothetical protein
VQAGRRRGDSDQELLEPQPTPNTHHSGLVWEMEDSSGWKSIEGDFEKF